MLLLLVLSAAINLARSLVEEIIAAALVALVYVGVGQGLREASVGREVACLAIGGNLVGELLDLVNGRGRMAAQVGVRAVRL